jgi:AraC-like DNA-binding protein
MDSPLILCTIRSMPGSELIFLYGEAVPACTHHIDKQYVGYCTLQYMSAGAVDLWLGPRHYRMEGRWFWSAYPGPRVRFHAAGGRRSWDHRYLAFQGPLLRRWEREGLFPVSPRRAPEGSDYGARFDELLRQSRRTDRRGVRRAIHLLEGILLELADAPIPADTPPAPWLDRATQRIAAWAVKGAGESPIGYATLAEELGTSESTLRRRFHDATGTSPHGYLLQCRAAEARRLLGETDLPVKAIADRLGYRDVYFFSRQFRQLTGVPPATYRRSRQG